MLETRCKYYENEAMFHGFIPHIMGTRFDILLIHSDIDRLNTLWADIAYELERLDKILIVLILIVKFPRLIIMLLKARFKSVKR